MVVTAEQLIKHLQMFPAEAKFVIFGDENDHDAIEITSVFEAIESMTPEPE